MNDALWNAHLALIHKIESDGQGVDKPDGDTVEEMAKPHKERLGRLTEAMPLKVKGILNYKKILDIGAGCGIDTRVLNDKGYDVCGLTLGKDNIVFAKKTLDTSIYEVDMHELSSYFPREYFDGAMMIDAFEHSHAPVVLLGELYYVLRAGARVMIGVPQHDAKDSQSVWHVNLLLPNQIIKYFEYWGFKYLTEYDSMSDDLLFFEKLPQSHPDFKNYGYLHWVLDEIMRVQVDKKIKRLKH